MQQVLATLTVSCRRPTGFYFIFPPPSSSTFHLLFGQVCGPQCSLKLG